MMSRFDPGNELIVVTARIHGPNGLAEVRLALDTGATLTVIAREPLEAVGYQVDEGDAVSIVTGSGREAALQIRLDRIETLDMAKISFPVLAYTLPMDVTVDGALGIDFFDDCRLTIDFRNNTIEVE